MFSRYLLVRVLVNFAVVFFVVWLLPGLNVINPLFGSVILEMWVREADEAKRRASFERFGEEIIEARKTYEKTRALDNALFGEDYEV